MKAKEKLAELGGAFGCAKGGGKREGGKKFGRKGRFWAKGKEGIWRRKLRRRGWGYMEGKEIGGVLVKKVGKKKGGEKTLVFKEGLKKKGFFRKGSPKKKWGGVLRRKVSWKRFSIKKGFWKKGYLTLFLEGVLRKIFGIGTFFGTGGGVCWETWF